MVTEEEKGFMKWLCLWVEHLKHFGIFGRCSPFMHVAMWDHYMHYCWLIYLLDIFYGHIFFFFFGITYAESQMDSYSFCTAPSKTWRYFNSNNMIKLQIGIKKGSCSLARLSLQNEFVLPSNTSNYTNLDSGIKFNRHRLAATVHLNTPLVLFRTG